MIGHSHFRCLFRFGDFAAKTEKTKGFFGVCGLTSELRVAQQLIDILQHTWHTAHNSDMLHREDEG